MNESLRRTALHALSLNIPPKVRENAKDYSCETNKEQSFVKPTGEETRPNELSTLEETENGQKMFSPMTELSINFQYSCTSSTPRRRLSLNDVSNNPTPITTRKTSRTDSFESGIGSEIGSPIGSSSDFENSPCIEALRSKSRISSSSFLFRKASLRRTNSSQASFGFPLKFEEENEENPLLPSSKLFRTETEEDSLSSEIKDVGLPVDLKPLDTENCTIPVTLRSFSAPPVLDSLENYFTDFNECPPTEDGFIDCFDDDVVSEEACLPPGLSGLIKDPILTKNEHEKSNRDVLSIQPLKSEESPSNNEQSKDKCNPLFKRPSLLMKKKARSISFSTKRQEPPRDFSPLSRKRYRSQSVYNMDENLNKASILQPHNPSPLRFARSLSDSDRVSGSPVFFGDIHDNLIGDNTRPFAFPCTKDGCQHPDLKGITSQTLVNAINHKYKESLDEIIIIDCRYPYEYKAGHIKGAVNIYEKEEMVDYLKHTRCSPNKKLALIFHCEFSSKRGPGMCRFLRNKDRDMHKHCYPRLYYPEMYILEGGYKDFFKLYKEYCEPQDYCTMCNTGHAQELKHFAKRSKSWTEGNSGYRTGLRY